MRALDVQEQRAQEAKTMRANLALQYLRPIEGDEDIDVAKARLQSWLDENEGRRVA